MSVLTSGKVALRIEGRISGEVVSALTTTFSRRYLPDPSLGGASPDILVDWYPGDSLAVVEKRLAGRGEPDMYVVRAPPPAPYTAEAPLFFVLQAVARAHAKKGYLVITDSVSFSVGGEAHLVLGYPHGGKSTVLAYAASKGAEALTTENTIVEVADDGTMYVVGGTDVLIADPAALTSYGIEPPWEPVGRTRHGYLIFNIRERGISGVPVRDISLIHCSLVSSGVSYSRIKGRKVAKTLWHFAQALIKGLDYYDPHPLSLSDDELDASVAKKLGLVAKKYGSSFREFFGAHDRVADEIMGGLTDPAQP